MSEQNQHAEALFDKLSREKKQRRRRTIRTVVVTIAVIAVVLVAVVMGLRRNVERRFAASAAEVLEYRVAAGTIHTVVSGSGVLTEEDLEELSVPAGVEITEVLVEAGDTVSQGDVLATVDMGTVMTALSSLQEQMEDLDDDINDAKGDEVSSYISAGVSGRIKKIYAEAGMDVSACMAEHGALALVSLDGYMAADVASSQLNAGDAVTVVREDGTALNGKVTSAGDGNATILVTDNGPRMEEEVTISAGGQEIGKAKLYIHNPLAVTGYAGTIGSVSLKENARVEGSTTVFQLKDTSFSASYDSLLRDRADLEETLMELLTLYRDSALLAPMDGRISSVEFDEDLPNTFQTETPVLTLYPNSRMSIAISIDETDILSLQEGQEAEVVVSSVSEEEIFLGSVTDISKVADTSTGVTRYSAEVTLDRAEGMLSGMTADVDVKIEGVENALIIPLDALHRTSATHFVYTSYDPETKQYGGMVEVTAGMQNDTQVEILSGLQEGDILYYTEAPKNIFEVMMGNMGGGTVTMGPARPSGGMPSGMGGPGGMNRGG